MSNPTSFDTLRVADLPTLATALNNQRTRSIDVVVPAKRLRSVMGAIELTDVAPLITPAVITEDGVTPEQRVEPNGFYVPTKVGDETIGRALGIPQGYLGKCRDEAIELYDSNVTGWCERSTSKYLLRLLTHSDGPGADGSAGVLRAMLSDSYRCIDNFDVLLAALRGISEAGVTDPVIDADLTDRRMVVRVSTPDIAALAPKLLEGYRSPFGGHDVGRGWTPDRVAQASAGEGQAIEGGGTVVFAGFVITNSETGGGKFNITPRLVVKVCNNGLTITADALSKVHLGSKLDDGVVKWSDETINKNLALITSRAKDAVKTFLTVDYVEAKVAELERDAGTEVDDAPAVVESVSKRLGFSEAEQTLILNHFIKGGQLTCGGIMQAVTSAAQMLPDGDAAYDMELKGVEAMTAAVAAVRSLARAAA